MPPRARAIILAVAEERGVELALLIKSCRQPRVFHTRVEIAKRLDVCGYSSSQIGKFLNHDHTTILFYLSRGKKKVSPERPPKPPRMRIWKTPRVRHLRWLTSKAKPGVIAAPQRYAGYDPSENQITLRPQQEQRL